MFNSEFTIVVKRVRFIETRQVDMEMENWSAVERRMVGKYDKIFRVGNEWESNLCYLTVKISHYIKLD